MANEIFLSDRVPANKEAFLAKVVSIANEIGIDPGWLMAIMYFESRLSPTAENPYTKATGLIQFMPSTARGLGTTVEDLRLMSNVRQLDYVRLYFLPFKGKLKKLSDTYLAVFYPALIGKPGDYILPSKVQEQNPVFRPFWVNGKLVKDSITKYFLSYVEKIKTLTAPINPAINTGLIVLAVIVIGLMVLNRL